MATTEQQITGVPQMSAESQQLLSKMMVHPPLIHVGKLKNKKSKRLKKGKQLPADLQDHVQQLPADLQGDKQHIIISYEAKPRKNRKKKNKIKFMGIKIDRKKLKSRMKKNGMRSSFL